MAAGQAFAETFVATRADTARVLALAVLFVRAHSSTWQEVEVALAEALNNIVDHAKLGQGLAELKIIPAPAGLLCQVRDQGLAYAIRRSDKVPDVAEHRGRGWVLIHGFCKNVTLARDGATNQLDLYFPENIAA